jgi:L-aspartate oxidase
VDLKDGKKLRTEVLVIGGGLAGLVAALTAAEKVRVLLLAKSPAGVSSNSALAQGGIAAAIGPDDSPDYHASDTFSAGRGLCDERAVQVLCDSAPRAIELLIHWGVAFDREEDGALSLGQEGGHSRRRIVHARGGATGEELMEALYARAREHLNIEILDSVEILRLLNGDGRCMGALGWNLQTGSPLRVEAGAVILATGGAGGLYERTTNSSASDGSGMAMAYEAGAELQDLEFIQFHPTALANGSERVLLISEAVRGEGAHLVNARGERFMPGSHERAELAPRDVVARCIDQEITRTGGVYLSLRHLHADPIETRFPQLVAASRERGFELTRDLIPVAPVAHYAIGGVATDLWGVTSVAGLYSCGEVACTGVHGANRLASNSLLECVVFGGRAGKSAAEFAKTSKACGLPELNVFDLQIHPGETSPGRKNRLSQMQAEMKRLMTQHVGLFRTRQGMQRALVAIETLQNELADSGPGVPIARLQRRLLVAKLIAQASLERAETRGVHARLDFPGVDSKWQRHSRFQRERQPCLTS